MSHLKLSALAVLVALGLPPPAHASFVRNDIDYQYFRDFAENKGIFVAGASHIPIYNKSNQHLGTLFTAQSMPDFSAVSRDGITTLVNPQYINSVTHNSHYGAVSFGHRTRKNPDAAAFDYLITARNNFDGADYHAPRLHKMVTEVAPAAMSQVGHQANVYADRTRFPMFVRMGSGTQFVTDSQDYVLPGNSNNVAGAYFYMTGGNIPRISSQPENALASPRQVFDTTYGPMATVGYSGDSGSPLFAYDAQQGKWVLASIYHARSDTTSYFTNVRPSWVQSLINSTVAGHLYNPTQGATFTWNANNQTSRISSGNNGLNVNLANPSLNDSNLERPSLAAGQGFNVIGRPGTLVLNNNINQGAGILNFATDFTVKPQADQTWVGGGISVDKGKTVHWQVKNPQGDRLSRLGQGTLVVSGKGVNLGDASLGDGVTVLAQKASNANNADVQAFNNLSIVSGRPTVVLADNKQINTDRLSFGYRGGRLELNGNDLTFNRIRNLDDGASIVNHGISPASITVTNNKTLGESEMIWGRWGQAGGHIYEYINTHRGNRTDYFMLKPDGNPWEFFPLDQNSSNSWQYIGSGRQQAVQTALNLANEQGLNQTFNGFLGEKGAGGQVSLKTADQLVWGRWGSNAGTIYEYINTHRNNRTDYFVLKAGGNPWEFYPLDQNSSNSWEFLGSDKEMAVKTVLARQNEQILQNHLASVGNPSYTPLLEEKDLSWGRWGQAGGHIYEYVNIYQNNRKDYFVLKADGNPEHFFPAYANHNYSWEYLGSDKAKAVKTVLSRLNAERVAANADYHRNVPDAKALTESDLVWGRWGSSTGTIYEYINTHRNNRTDYFVLKAGGNPWEFYPLDQNSSNSWEFLGSDRARAVQTILARENAKRNGELNVNFSPNDNRSLWLLNGGANLNGKFSINGGSVVLSGLPTPHAYDYINDKEVVVENDWISRDFAFNDVEVKNQAKFTVSRNVANFKANLTAYHQANVNVGFINGFTPTCRYSLDFGTTTCTNAVAASTLASLPTTQMQGNVALYDQAQFTLGKAHLTGHIQAGDNTQVSLSQHSGWTMTGNSQLGHLSINNGQIWLSQAHSPYQTLRIKGNLSGQGNFYYRTNLAQNQGDSVQVDGIATGNHRLHIQNSGQELGRQGLSYYLFGLNHPNQANYAVNVSLNGANYVDLGAYRYTLVQDARGYRLYNNLVRDNAMPSSYRAANTTSQPLAQANPYTGLVKLPINNAEPASISSYDSNGLAYDSAFDTALPVTADNPDAQADTATLLLDLPNTQAAWVSQRANLALSELSGQFNSLEQIGSSISRHLANKNTQRPNVWASSEIKRTQNQSDRYRHYEQDNRLQQVGAEMDVGANSRLGLILSYNKGESDFDQGGKNDSKLTSLTVFGKHEWQNGAFVSLDGSLGKAKSKISLEGTTERFDRTVASLGANLGKSWDWQGLELQPQVGVRYHRLSGVDYHLADTAVRADSLDLVSYQAGVKAAYRFDLDGITLRPSVSAHYVDASHKQQGITLNQVAHLSQKFGRYGHYEAGITTQLGNWQASLGLGYLEGNEIGNQKLASVKVGYRW
ncbi:hypothetical protein A4G20_02295 [Pasteurellaceae bacterium RH1A]|nr:hypothetical protein A4G20_02295 [Pasteurellaceae bacterium RH1A]